MRSEFQTLAVAKSTGADGASLRVDGLVRKAVQFSGGFTSTLALQISLNDVEFFTVATATGRTVVEVPQLAKSMRIHTTTYVGSDDPIVTLGGFDSRSDV